MSDQEKEQMLEFLKENLSIQVSAEKEWDFGNEYVVVNVTLLLDGEEISTCGACIPN